MDEQQLKAELDAVYRSLSWRITMPLREVSAVIQGKQSLLSFLKRAVKFVLRRLLRISFIAKLCSFALQPFPDFHARLRQSLFPRVPEAIEIAPVETQEIIIHIPQRDVQAELSPAAYSVYAFLHSVKHRAN